MIDGFIQFGDGKPIPVTDISIEWERDPAPHLPHLPLLSEFEVTLPMSIETGSKILRIVGEESLADRINIAIHPDLAELNLQLDGFYGGQP
ncbi:hypothetical protein Caci_2959 [Catenulispora acidiphila DSM 44928]|uniref:Uncharacterized protein n=1 Tax=Catenulispora acidiphila (strain DSM 44928 / JCM 14897 / NBRC 102108 / NRRL B-24433 / ID139908) TaxID=479433 RepID=C7Q2X6_CATAD|nr:hypothetical protein [Catenulispora acidiphila]ACU71868.1 hypothetical protein Caci_2959 [Catenulispora acidiphila DSM 44928]